MDNRLPAGVTGNEPIFQDALHQPKNTSAEMETIAEFLEAKPAHWEWAADVICDLTADKEFLCNLTQTALNEEDMDSSYLPLSMLRDRLYSTLNEKAAEWKEEELSEARFD